ncbi:MAG TPA: YraN family protein [Candidatus Kapabacteria bacterium]|nr:YraN family protein [Candidatus Kapabacteria bacterium]
MINEAQTRVFLFRHERAAASRFEWMSFEMEIGEKNNRKPAKLTRDELAKLGEEHAAKHVAALGYRIVKRNFRFGKVGEIDIVAYDGECLVFIEVKARQDNSYGTPESAVDARKQGQLKRVAKMYYYVNAISEAVCRFDVIAVDLFGNKVDIRHHKNAFY